MDLGLKGKKAIVTGGTRGIGAAIVDVLLEEGVDVSTCARNAAEVEALNTRAATSGQSLHASVCDVSNAAAQSDWITGRVAAMGGLDIFIPNVSGGAQAGEDGWKSAFEIDMMATVRGSEQALPIIAQAGGGAIVIIASISGLEGFSGPSGYGAIKAGLISYSSQLAEVAAAHNVRVNAVSPGPIHVDDGFWGKVKQEQPEMYDAVCARHPSGRMGTTKEVANAAVFLASPAASWVAGTNLVVDGSVTRRVQF